MSAATPPGKPAARRPSPAQRRLLQFIAVGVVAAAVHLGVVAGLVEGLHWPALWANPLGWAVAFLVSFAGHRGFTFAEQAAPLGRSIGRFATVSATGFAVNEAAYAAVLHTSGLHYALALGLVLVAVAVATYLAGRHWAFKGS